MQSLYPTAPSDLTEEDLVGLYAYPTERVWVRANFVASLDGATHGGDARSGSLSSATDKALFALLRSLCDVVLVGAGTARAEGYQPVLPGEVDAGLRADLGLTSVPAIAVVSRSMAIDPGLLAGGDAPTIVVTSEAAAHDHADTLESVPVVAASPPDDPHVLDLWRAVDGLVAHGYQRLLCEGGPTLLHDLVACHRLDELCLTISSLLVGGDPLRILRGSTLTPPVRLQLRHLLTGEGDLFCRYTTRPAPKE